MIGLFKKEKKGENRMAERIVQLRESEYEELVKTSKLKKKQIVEQAKKLWEERGAARLYIEIRTKSDTYYTRTFDCRSWVWEKDERFCIPQELRERLSKFLQKEIRWEIEQCYGEPLKVINAYNKKIESQDKWFRLAWLVAVSGWVVAAILLL